MWRLYEPVLARENGFISGGVEIHRSVGSGDRNREPRWTRTAAQDGKSRGRTPAVWLRNATPRGPRPPSNTSGADWSVRSVRERCLGERRGLPSPEELTDVSCMDYAYVLNCTKKAPEKTRQIPHPSCLNSPLSCLARFGRRNARTMSSMPMFFLHCIII